MHHVLTLPVKVPPDVYLDVKMAGSMSKVMEGSVQFRILVDSEVSTS